MFSLQFNDKLLNSGKQFLKTNFNDDNDGDEKNKPRKKRISICCKAK